MPTDIPEIDVVPARRSLLQRVSVVWIVPIGALLVALGIAWQTWSNQGPVILVMFDEAFGVKARETELRYRDVAVGRVERVRFSGDLGRVEVSIRVDKDIAPYVDGDAAFWVVRPEVSTRGVTGLDTVLSGVFIEGVWDTQADGLIAAHDGLNSAPLLKPGEQGTTFTLRAQPGTTLAEGTAITYKGIEVGRVGKPEVRAGAAEAGAPAVIYAPYDRILSTATRFWDTSGFSFSLGAGGANLDFTSLASLIAGGVAFDTLVSGGVPLTDAHTFELFGSEQDARSAVFDEGRGKGVSLSIVFDENANGLVVGSPVQFNGIVVGEVTNVSGLVDTARFRDQKVRLQVVIEVNAVPLGLTESATTDAVLEFLDRQVAAGLRARLATASILTGGIRVELVTVDKPVPASLDLAADPFPALPTTESAIADAGATAQGVLRRINDLPIEELLQSAINFLQGSTALVTNGELARIPGELRTILGDVGKVASSDDLQKIPARVSAVLEDVQGTVKELKKILATFEEARAIERLLSAIDAAGTAADSIRTGVSGAPELIASLTATAETARQLPLKELLAKASEVVASADALLNAPGAKNLPEMLNASLGEVRAALKDLREGGAIASLNATMSSAQEAAAAVATAAQSLPEITRRLNATLETANSTLKSVDGGSEFNRVARQALTDVSRAAKSVESLSRAIERQPNSILLGR